jgi:catechol 2,3-dioxygenase-like lactoylglutathione lyase family enzyme
MQARRPRLTFGLVSAFVLATLAAHAAFAAPLVTSVDEVALTVSDADLAASFYKDVLGFSSVSDRESASEAVERLEGVFGARVRAVRLRLGDESVVLMQFLAPVGRTIPSGQRSNDGGFQHLAIVVSDMDAAYRRLREHHVRHVSNAPQTLPAWNQAAGGIRAFYFADPDGHTLELIWFPRGKGDPRWQRPQAPLFQGIDHTAIGVADTDASLRLYRDRLGLRVAGTSDNQGTEQEHLNAVFGAHLRITGLRAATGPGIELLEYLSPRDGRAAPADLRANDLLHWQTTLKVDHADAALKASVSAAARPVSSGVVRLSDVPLGPVGGKEGVLVRDPDGHGLLLVN